MSTAAVRQFLSTHYPAAAGLSALCAALEALATGDALDPALAARIDELLRALGGDDLLADVSPVEAGHFLSELRHQLSANHMLLHAYSRATSWSMHDERFLQEVGTFARLHAHALRQSVLPQLDGVEERLAREGAAFLDVGVGVAGTATEVARLWPAVRVVGIDVWAPSLRLARENVAAAGLGDRIELREQAAEALEDESAFDVVWMPILFMAERGIPTAMARCRRALRPGGWVLASFVNHGVLPPAAAAMWRLRTTTWGGPLWGPEQVELVMRDAGFAEVRTLASPPGVPIVFVAGRSAG
jgi:ubiquinone/menaquinone biosynthesis C-methylase UbiE